MSNSNKPSLQPTNSELAILQILWKRGEATVREVHDQLAEEKDTRYTTTLKTMQGMRERGFIRRKTEDQKHVYYAAIAKEDTQIALLDVFLQRTFGGSALQLVMKALGNYDPNEEELDQLKEMIRQKEKNTQKHDN